MLGALTLGWIISWRQGLLLLVGGGFGLALYHAAFGFTHAWRVFIADRRGQGLRVQMLLLALTVAVFFPALAVGELFGRPVFGFVVPAGMMVAIGAFIFGIGMGLLGNCSSGTITVYAEKRRHGSLARDIRIAPAVPLSQRLLRGPWPLVWGALALALLSIATLWLAGRPWGITSAFALWGAKIADTAGVDVSTWPYWSGGRLTALANSVFYDTTSVMNFGIVLGALLAAGLAGKFAPGWRIPPRQLAAAVIGGLMLGYGARLASGCNIGAYYGGIVSGSLHGWLWLVAGFAGRALAQRRAAGRQLLTIYKMW